MLVAPHLVPCCLSCTVVCHGWASRRFAMPSPSPVLCHVFHAVVYEAVVPHRSPCPYQSSLVACRRSRVSAVGHDVRARLTRTYDITSTSSRHLSTIVWRRHSRGANFFTFSFLYLHHTHSSLWHLATFSISTTVRACCRPDWCDTQTQSHTQLWAALSQRWHSCRPVVPIPRTVPARLRSLHPASSSTRCAPPDFPVMNLRASSFTAL
jgi:hypothetical protein